MVKGKNMQPYISVVIPVYNVEKYLRQCLDSILNQTLPEIQVICVDDGSTDSSPFILAEYAKRDNRITIITQENLGAGSARNAATPFLRGKYTHFADSDDWTDTRLYEYGVRSAEISNAEIVLAGCRIVNSVFQGEYLLSYPPIRTTWYEKEEVLLHATAPWYKIFRTDFLRTNNIRFCGGKRPNNDLVHHWKSAATASKIQILRQPLYYYRVREGSCQTTGDEGHLKLTETIEEIKTFLMENDFYKDCSYCFTLFKLTQLFEKYNKIRPEFQEQMKEQIQNSLRNEELAFIDDENRLTTECRKFYIQLTET
jgi:glycosyltransferase involved in cell wall biosynthesis